VENHTTASAHTPGPWLTTKSAIGTWHIHLQDGSTLAEVGDGPFEDDKAQVEANALLIAAAPEMLEAIENQILNWEALMSGEWDGNHDSIRNTLRRLNAVVAKANGR
jgi:hypothetical protein